MKKYLVFFLFFFPVFAVQAEPDVVSDVFETLNQDYLSELSNKEITVKGLKSLSKVDPNIKLSPTEDHIFLYFQNKMVGKFPFPADQTDARAFVALTNQIINKAIQVSPQAELLDFELPDRFAQSVFENLDGYSHYFGAFTSEPAARPSIRRPFVVRTIGSYLLIRLQNFQKDVHERVKSAIEECSACQGLVLDLRGNHGGLLSEAVEIASAFLDEGIITYTQSQSDSAPQFYTAESGDIFKSKPVVILVDGFTASAAEVLAAALSEQNRAVLIGSKTYGKGTVQNVKKLDSDHALSVTTSYFYTPSGQKIEKQGLTPAICTNGATDIQSLASANCEKADLLDNEFDIDLAVMFLEGKI